MGYEWFLYILTSIILFDYFSVKYDDKLNFKNYKNLENDIKYGLTYLLLSHCLLYDYFGSNAFLFWKSFTEFIGGSIKSPKDNLKNWYCFITFIFAIITNTLSQYFVKEDYHILMQFFVVPIDPVILIVMGSIFVWFIFWRI